MKNNEAIRIAIAETSVIIRGGLTAALKRLPNVKVQPIELLMNPKRAEVRDMKHFLLSLTA